MKRTLAIGAMFLVWTGALAAYEEGEPLPQVKTVEGSPEGGLRYRLRMRKEASADDPDRLIVWLHPAGGSFNKQVEALSPAFAELRFALLVTTDKDFSSWTGEDARRLLGATLGEVASLPGIDAAHPILMGFSGGGQLALDLWYEKPEAFGGLVVDAAYPVEVRRRRHVPRPLPHNPAIRTTPVLAIVGSDDALTPIWREVEPRWRAAGVPLTLRVVPGRRHEWLFEGDEVGALLDWLRRLRPDVSQ